MRNFFTRFFSVLCCLFMATNFCYAEDQPTGGGTEDNPYQISSAENLYWFAKHVNEGGDNLNACAVLTANIIVNTLEFDLDGNLITEGKNYRIWDPIWKKDYDNQYQGTFDGKGFTISGLYFNNSNQDYVGLFGDVGNKATIQNVGVVDSYIKGRNYVGGLCGELSGNINKCFSSATVKGNSYVGGICGYIYQGKIENCYNTGLIKGNTDLGGVAGGCFESGIMVKYCYTITTNTVLGSCKDGEPVNSYYLADTDDGKDGKTIEQFRSGEVAYLLNPNIFEPVWGQDLTAENSLPTINGPQLYEKDGKYYNESNLPYDEYGICEFPLVTFYHPAELVDGVYKISNAGELCWFAQHVVNGGTRNACAELTADITFPNYEIHNWDRISEYQGTFDGKGHTISKVFCELFAENYVGLFGINNGTIKNVGIVDSHFGGKEYVGSVCGYNNGIIENCYSSSTYKGDENDGGVFGEKYIGGLCGVNEGTIKYCYNSGKVEASVDSVGGLCGANRASGKITSCFSTGIVIYYKETDASYGSLCGYNEKSDSINNCYTTVKSQYLNDYYGKESEIVLCKKCEIINTNYYLCDEDNGNGGKTEKQFHSGEVAYLLGQSDNVWGQDLTDENSLPTPNAPKVDRINEGDEEYCPYYNTEDGPLLHDFDENGICTRCHHNEKPSQDENDVYQISNAGELYWFANFVNGGNPSANAVLTNNIVVNANVLNEDGTLKGDNFVEWTPIGVSENNQFTGVFNGQNYTISGLYLSNTEQSFVGLFGYIDNGATIQNLGVVDSYFEGNENIGGLCGVNANGLIENCYSESSVKGTNYAGGLCGYASTGTIKNSYNVGSVEGVTSAGGLCGENHSANIENCYNAGSVEGATFAGGLCGVNYSDEIKNCYNAGSVTGLDQVGGICGVNHSAEIENCYNNSDFYAEGDLTTFDFCNGSLLHGFADTIWSVGSHKIEDGVVTFTLPHFINGYEPIVKGEFSVTIKDDVYYYDSEFTQDNISEISIKVGDNVYSEKDSLLLIDVDLSDSLITGTFYGVEFSVKVNLKDYTFIPTFIWNTEAETPSATVTIACNENSKHDINNADCIVSKIEGSEKAPTCEDAGSIDYMATYESYSDTITLEIPALEHKYGEPVFTWTLDKTSVEGVVVCENDKTHTLSGASKEISTDTTKATCTEKGKIVYSAVVEINGKQYTLKDSVELPALGHKYGEPVFTWNDDYTHAVATFTCLFDDDKQTVENVVITSDTTVAPTTEKEGEITYTATAAFNGKSYMDVQTTSLEKLKGGELTSLANTGSDSFIVYVYQNQIYVKSTKPGTLDIYDLNSRLVEKNVRYEEGITPVAILPNGIYVVKGKKLIVK